MNYYEVWMNKVKNSIFVGDMDSLMELCREVENFPENVLKQLLTSLIEMFRIKDDSLNTDLRVVFIRNFTALSSAISFRLSMLNKSIVDDNFTGIIESISNGRKFKKGFVYLLKAVDEDMVKIGISIHRDKRTNNIKVQMPFKCQRIFIKEVLGYDECEKYLHGLFKDKRLNGEWFAFNYDDIEEVKGCINQWSVNNGDISKIKSSRTFEEGYAKPEAEKCLDIILGKSIELNTSDGKIRRTLGMWIKEYYNLPSEFKESSRIPKQIAGYGVKINNDETFDIATSFSSIKDSLRDTSWDSIYGRLLRKHKYAVSDAPKTARFNGSGKGIVRIKLKGLKQL